MLLGFNSVPAKQEGGQIFISGEVQKSVKVVPMQGSVTRHHLIEGAELSKLVRQIGREDRGN